MRRDYLTLAVVFLVCFIGLAIGADVSPEAATVAAPVVPADGQSILDAIIGLIPAKWIAAAWVISTALGIVLGAVAWCLKKWNPDSKAALLVDTIAHWLSVIGTSVRPSQAVHAAPGKV